MARELGVSFSTVNRWERGKTTPSPLASKSLEGLDSTNCNDADGKRQSLRLKAHCPVEIRLLGSDVNIAVMGDIPSFDVVTENLSSTGLMFKTLEKVSTGKKIGIGWNLGEKHVETLSEVVWIKGEGADRTIGVRFDYPIPGVVSTVIDSILEA